MESTTLSTARRPTSYPRAHMRPTLEDDPMDELLYGSQRTDGDDEKDFRGSTLSYITDGVEFLKHLGNHGLADCTMLSALADSYSDHADDDDADKTIQLSPQTHSPVKQMHTSQEETAQNTSDKSREVLRTALKQGLKWGVESIPDKDSTIGQIAQKISLTQDKYIFYHVKETRFHQSYEWLLRQCSQMLDTTPASLQKSVHHLEAILLIGLKNLRERERNMVTHFHRRYFPANI